MTTLSDGVTTVELDDDLDWANEFNWADVLQTKTYTLTGALLLESAARQAGRQIELRGGDAFGWMLRSAVEQLKTWARLAGQQLTLTLRGTEYTVVFDHEAGCLEARPVVDFSDPEPGDHYVVTLRFLVV